ncbi:MAG: Ribosomal protein L11 methyltransferase [Clostridia bacterium 62_21]|nr:MAG: Ribosomal protein L11 methyltransferase [Clostridia bacterium 62_21]
MTWVEVSVTVERERADAVAGIFFEMGSGVLWEEPAPALVTVKGYFPAGAGVDRQVADLRRSLAAVLESEPGVGVRQVREEDWAHAWRRHYRPFRVGKRFVVRPPWEEYPGFPDDLVIVLDPGMAFGCGTHPTTQMCLAMLEEAVRPGMRVCDVGTGSGILAIAAALLGAGRVEAVDNDPTAVRVARKNVEANGLAGKIDVRQGYLLDAVEGPLDLVVANITADVILRLVPAAARVLAPGGVFIAGGIIRDRMPEVIKAVAGAGWRRLRTEERGEWAMLAGVTA